MTYSRTTELLKICYKLYFTTNVFEQEPYKSVFANNPFEPSIFTKEPFISIFKRGL